MAKARMARKKPAPSNFSQEELFELEVTIAKNLKMYRELFGLTQQELAKKIGSSVQTVAHWEQGLKVPRPEWLGALAKLYDVEVGVFFNIPPKTKGRRTKRVK
jgi:transcriptional regulator with XRE-family HTH domain